MHGFDILLPLMGIAQSASALLALEAPQIASKNCLKTRTLPTQLTHLHKHLSTLIGPDTAVDTVGGRELISQGLRGQQNGSEYKWAPTVSLRDEQTRSGV
jgi:hypothetical protein